MAGEFDAFISYSRRASAALAGDLQTAVERFAKPAFRLRAVRVFRDDQSMSANTALWSTIERALTQAEWFVLLASPAAAASEYVGSEVRWWLEHKSSDRVLIVLEEGVDIAWDRAVGDFDFTVTDSLPPALAGAFAEEPRWIDLRWYEAGGSLKQADPRWPERVADIAAAVRGVERDQLVGENVRIHRRLVRLRRGVIVGLSVLTVLALLAAGVAVSQRRTAQHQTRVAVAQRERATAQARIALGRQLAAEALSLAPDDIRTASLLAVQAYRTSTDAQTRAALFQLATASPHLVRTLPVGAEVTASAVTPDGQVVTGDADGRVQVWNGDRPTTRMTLDASITSVSASDDGGVVAAAASDAGQVLVSTPAGTLSPARAVNPFAVRVDATGTRLAVSGGGDTGQGTEVYGLDGAGATYRGRADAEVDQLGFGPSGLVGFSYSTSHWVLIDPDSGALLDQGDTHPGGMGAGVAVSAEGNALAQLTDGTDQRIWTSTASLHGAPGRGDRVAHGTAVAVTGALSADGQLLALQSDGGLEVATVQDPNRPPGTPVELAGAGTDLTAGNYHALSFGGDRYVVSADGATAYVWDLDQLSRLGHDWPAHIPVGCTGCLLPQVSTSPDGTRALATAPDGWGTTVVTLADGHEERLGRGRGSGLVAASWVDAEHLVAVDRDELVAVDADTGTETPLMAAPTSDVDLGIGGEDGHTVLAIEAQSVDDPRAVVVLGDGSIVIVDLGAGTIVRRVDDLVAVSHVWGAGISPDGRSAWLVRSDQYSDYYVILAALPSGRVVWKHLGTGAAYDGHGDAHVFSTTRVVTIGTDGAEAVVPARVADFPVAAIDSGGTTVASGGTTGSIDLLALGHQASLLGSIPVPQRDQRTTVSAFGAAGRTLVTAVQPMGLPDEPNGSLRVTSLRPADWITAACAVAGRDLTAADWARYGSGPAPEDLRCAR